MSSPFQPRNQEMLRLYLEVGCTLQQIAETFGLTRERVRQIIRKQYPDYDQITPAWRVKSHEKAQKEYTQSVKNALDKWGCLPSRLRTAEQQAHFDFFRRKKQNARRTQHSWEISMQDLKWPTHCPMLGMELDWNLNKRGENSPSLDRLDNTEGYVPGNVAIISYRANRIKNDGTWQEHEAIAQWLKINLCQAPPLVLTSQ